MSSTAYEEQSLVEKGGSAAKLDFEIYQWKVEKLSWDITPIRS